MLHTQEDAKQRWCPFARYKDGFGGEASNRWKQSEPTPHALNPVPCRCIASECMAWRWKAEQETHVPADSTAQAEPRRPARVPADWTWEPANIADDGIASWVEPRRGYCGLAGEPRP